MITEQRFSGPVLLNLATGPASGPPLLCLHGVLRRWQDFLTLIPPLALRWQVHALDFRGHGHSERAPSYRVIDYLEDALACLTGAITAPAVLYGHSLGALVALGTAARLPERVQAVVLEDPPGPAFMRNLQATPYHAQFTQMRPFAGRRDPVSTMAAGLAEIRLPAPGGGTRRLGDLRDGTSLRFSARCLQEVDPAVFEPLESGNWLQDHDEDLWRQVRCPVLLLRGNEELGGMLEAAAAEQIRQMLPDCVVVDLPSTGHLIHWLEPAATLRLVMGFLESIRAG